MAPADLRVGRLRVEPGPGHSAIVARLRAEDLVRRLDLGGSAGPPRRDVLVVRHLTVAGSSLTDRQQAARELADLRQRAARPARGPVDPGAAAVLFADEVEYLACLTADLVAGRAQDRWYWRHLFGPSHPEPAAVLATEWALAARWLPALFRALPVAVTREAVAQLTSSQIDAVDAGVRAAFRLGPPEPGVGGIGGAMPIAGTPGDEQAGVSPAASDAPAVMQADRVGELRPEGQRLIELVARLAGRSRAPWRRPPAGPSRAGFRPSPAPTRSSPAGLDVDSLPMSGPTPPFEAAPAPAGSTAALTATGHSEAVTVAPPAPPGTEGSPASAVPLNPPAGPAQPRARPDVEWGTTGVVTGYASLILLVNLVSWLEDDAREEWTDGILSGWDLVAALGRHLLGPELDAGDPIWGVLAELAGRPADVPPVVQLGHDEPIRVPTHWVRRATPDRRWIAWTQPDRVLVGPADRSFTAADVPTGGAAPGSVEDAEAARWTDAMGPDLSIAVERRSPTTASPGPRARWASTIGHFVDWLLSSHGVGSASFARPGRLALTRTHLDVVLPLDEVDLDLRMAGLDRDPGWTPQLGRIILFHFVEETAPWS